MEEESSSPPPPVLEYRKPEPQPVSAVRFPGFVTVLLLIDTLLGAAMVLSIFFIDRLRGAGVLMVVAGGLLLFAIFGCLSRERPRFGRALVLAIVAAVTSGVSNALASVAAKEVEAALARGKVGPVQVFVLLDSVEGGKLESLRQAGSITSATAMGSLALAVYLVVRLRRIRTAARLHA